MRIFVFIYKWVNFLFFVIMHNKNTLFVTLNAVKGLKKDSSLRSE